MSDKSDKPEESEKKEKKEKNRFWGIFSAGFLWGIAVTFIFGVIFLRHSLINEYQSKLGFEETVAALGTEAKATKGWLVRKPSCSLPQPKDKTKITAMKLCHAKYASDLLDDENSRKVSAMIPCTFAVYQKSDGKTYISRMNVSLLGSLLGGKSGKIFPGKVTPDQEKMLETVIGK
jgi:uncharacterized protein (DUF302 family)